MAENLLVETVDGHECVDLGLRVKWAACNVGASVPSDAGDYFAWGETKTKERYFEDNFVPISECVENGIAGDVRYDAARAKWGGAWRMPRREDWEELQRECEWTWTTVDGMNGYRVKGPNGNAIFLPAAGLYWEERKYDVGSCGYYWADVPHFDGKNLDALEISFTARDLFELAWANAANGISLRPVLDRG